MNSKSKAYYENNRKRLQEKTRNGNGSLLMKEKGKSKNYGKIVIKMHLSRAKTMKMCGKTMKI